MNDFYAEIAAAMFRTPVVDVTAGERLRVKHLVLRVFYPGDSMIDIALHQVLSDALESVLSRSGQDGHFLPPRLAPYDPLRHTGRRNVATLPIVARRAG